MFGWCTFEFNLQLFFEASLITNPPHKHSLRAQAGTLVREDAALALVRDDVPRFVCRAGLKLDAALDGFGISVVGLRVLDAGLSTGGFTDCVLQRGAAHVWGVDVG